MTIRALTPAQAEKLVLDTTPYLSCDDCFELLDTYVEATIVHPGHRDPGMQRHLAGCPACAHEAETLRQLLLMPEMRSSSR